MVFCSLSVCNAVKGVTVQALSAVGTAGVVFAALHGRCGSVQEKIEKSNKPRARVGGASEWFFAL
jgi:hypothetical protein